MCFFPVNSSLAGNDNGDEVRNGGGLAEQYLVHALSSLPKIIDRCLIQAACAQNPQDRVILKQIKATVAQEIEQDVLKFSSERERPGFFIIDGYSRLAVTGNTVGSPIYYNLDLLYAKNEIRMNFGQAIQSLVHELGHHHGSTDHAALELLGAEVRREAERMVSEAPFFPHLSKLGFSVLGTEAKSFDSSGSLLLIFKDNAFDMTPHFTKILSNCDQSAIDPLASSAVQFFNLHWKYGKETSLAGEKILEGNVFLYCRHRYLKQYRKFYEFALKVKVDFKERFIFSSSQLVEAPKYLFTNRSDIVINDGGAIPN